MPQASVHPDPDYIPENYYLHKEDYDPELKVINSIYDKFYVNQKLPNKKRTYKHKTKYFR